MERIKNMSLKKSFFTIALIFLLAGIILAVITLIISMELQSGLAVGNQITINYDDTLDVEVQPGNSDWRAYLISVLQIILPVIYVIVALFLAAIVFYRLKLKKPLAELQNGATRIAKEDLGFSIEKSADDELGELCVAFEAMRAELLENKRELWRQIEERKRLNAAFSHDLRNPVTVLKGAAKILQTNIAQDDFSADNIRSTIDLIAKYTQRIERYIEAMSSAQRLEDLKCTKQATDWITFVDELKTSLPILSGHMGKDVRFICDSSGEQIWVDKSIIQNVAENLLGNALRYAKNTVSVKLNLDSNHVILCVFDDGPGFSDTILKKGGEPFLHDNAVAKHEHFGMGLYVCRLLCEKHGGALTMENTPDGAKVTATFSYLKP